MGRGRGIKVGLVSGRGAEVGRGWGGGGGGGGKKRRSAAPMVAAANAFAALGKPVQAPRGGGGGGGGGGSAGGKASGGGKKSGGGKGNGAAPPTSKKAQKKAQRQAEKEREQAAADRGGFETVGSKGSAGSGGSGGARAALFLALADQAASGSPPGAVHLASAVQQAMGAPLSGAEEAALRKLLFALPGGGDGARAKSLAGAIAGAAKLAGSAPKSAGPEAARALSGAAALAVQRLAAPGVQQAAPGGAAAAPAPEASDAARASLRAAGDARAGARLALRAAASDTLLQQQTLRLEVALGVNARPVAAGAASGGSSQGAFGSFQEAEDVLDIQGKRESRRRLTGDRDSAVAEAARLGREIAQAEAKVASLKARRQALQDQISGSGADPRAADAADAHDQEALALLRAMEAAVPGAPAAAKRASSKGAPSAASQADTALAYVKVVREAVLAKQAAQQVLRRRLRFCVEQLAAVEADLEVAAEVPDAEAVEAVQALAPKLEEMLAAVLAEGTKLEAEASSLGKTLQRLLGLLPGSAKGKCRADADFCRQGITQITQFQSLLSAEATRRQAQPEEYYAAATSLAEEPEAAPSGAGAEPEAPEQPDAATEGSKPKGGKSAKGGGKAATANGKPKANPWNKLATMEANGRAAASEVDDSGLLEGPPLS